MKARPSLLSVCAVLVVVAGIGYAQYFEDSIDVGGAWVGSLVYGSELDEVWGSSWGGNNVFAIDCDSNKVVATLAMSHAGDVAYDSVDGKVYCAYYGADTESLAVINAATRQVMKRFEMPGSTTPVWDAASNRVYVSCQTTNSVAVVDCATDSVLTYIPVGACPMKMYVNTLRSRLYVLNHDDGTVSIVNMSANQVIKTVVVGGTPNAAYYCQSVGKLYSAGTYGECIVIGGAADSIVARIPAPGTEDLLCATGNETMGIVFAGMFAGSSGYIIAIDAEADTVLYTQALGHAFAQGLLYSTKSGYVYSANYEKSVSVLTGDGSRIVKEMPLGDAPFVIASAPSHSRLYIGNLNTRWVYVLRDTTTGAIAEPQSPHPEPRGISVTPNPFSQSLAVAWTSLAKEGDVARVYAQDGRLVRQARIPAGEARWDWDGRDERGRPVPPGVYVVAAPGGIRAKAVKLM